MNKQNTALTSDCRKNSIPLSYAFLFAKMHRDMKFLLIFVNPLFSLNTTFLDGDRIHFKISYEYKIICN